MNFSPKNKWLSWYIGGLNFQVEYHLFPALLMWDYPAIAPIVRVTAEEFGIPDLTHAQVCRRSARPYRFSERIRPATGLERNPRIDGARNNSLVVANKITIGFSPRKPASINSSMLMTKTNSFQKQRSEREESNARVSRFRDVHFEAQSK
jgi:hypothetical protein